MARPIDQHPKEVPGHYPAHWELQHERASLQGQLASLRQLLERIFRYVHPEGPNLESYGHETRNLLILACTEVEASFQAILNANGYPKTRLTTTDYVLLKDAMKLDAYGFGLPSYPWLSTIKPFESWSSSAPTQSLFWYNAYNNVKHNREDHFSEATLTAAVNAVCACAILVRSQFGFNAFGRGNGLDEFFVLESGPEWRFSEVYTHPYGSASLTARAYPF
jgi:hypothetical protein